MSSVCVPVRRTREWLCESACVDSLAEVTAQYFSTKYIYIVYIYCTYLLYIMFIAPYELLLE